MPLHTQYECLRALDGARLDHAIFRNRLDAQWLAEFVDSLSMQAIDDQVPGGYELLQQAARPYLDRMGGAVSLFDAEAISAPVIAPARQGMHGLVQGSAECDV